MSTGRIRAVALAVGLVAWNGLVDPRLPARWQPLVRAALGSVLMVGTSARPGLLPPALWSGLRLGAAAATTVSAGVAATSAVPVVRTGMRRKVLPAAPGRWLALRIPLGTVWPEEAAFRGALAYHADYADVHYHLAHQLDARGESADATEHWRAFLALAPDSPWAEEARERLATEAQES